MLYAVIIVSALIIAGAIPVLLRARRMAQAEPAARSDRPRLQRPPGADQSQAPRTVGERARTSNVPGRRLGGRDWSGEAVDRVWLRGTVVLTGTMGRR